MNRAERRAYDKKISKDPNSKYCKYCKKKTLHIAEPLNDGSYQCKVICERCKSVLVEHCDAIPFTYV